MSRRKKRRNYDWEAIEREYRAGQMTLRELNAAFGPAISTIKERATRYGWERNLNDKVKQAADAQLLKDGHAKPNTKPNIDPETEQEIVRTAAARVVEVIRQHRSTLGQLHETSRKLLGLVTRYAELAEKQANARTKGGRERFDAEMTSLRTAMGETPIAAINRLAAAIERVVNLERKAFNIEDKERSADDMIPLADRLKAYQREQAIQDSPNVTRMRGNGHG